MIAPLDTTTNFASTWRSTYIYLEPTLTLHTGTTGINIRYRGKKPSNQQTSKHNTEERRRRRNKEHWLYRSCKPEDRDSKLSYTSLSSCKWWNIHSQLTNTANQRHTGGEEEIVSKDDDQQQQQQHRQQPPQYGGFHYDVNETISNSFCSSTTTTTTTICTAPHHGNTLFLSLSRSPFGLYICIYID